MHFIVEEAPLAFMERYNSIQNGDRKIKNVADLKDFMLFAVEQGWKYPTMREWIAHLAYNIQPPDSHFDYNSSVGRVYDSLEALFYISDEDDGDGWMSAEYPEHSDYVWHVLEELVKAIDPKDYEN